MYYLLSLSQVRFAPSFMTLVLLLNHYSKRKYLYLYCNCLLYYLGSMAG